MEPDLKTPFDYIVVGGGTSGLVVASRISEDASVRVLVVEAGPDNSNDSLVLTPGLMAAQYGNEKYDWIFSSTPQPALHDRRIMQPRGRQLGGSSALNYMLAMYPSREIMDGWGQVGNSDWSLDALAPYYKKFSTFHAPTPGHEASSAMAHDTTLSGSGPVHVSYSEQSDDTGVNDAWMKTFASLGLEKLKTDSRTGSGLMGTFQLAVTIDPATKARSYAASAYYGPEVRKRNNLVILTEAVVYKITFSTMEDQVVATGIVLQTKDSNEPLSVSASAEVILAAGALQSPQILELSGIGGHQLLESLGIPVILDNPAVGENVQDHVAASQSFEVADGVTSGDALGRDSALFNSALDMYKNNNGAGPLGSTPLQVNTYATIPEKEALLKADLHKAEPSQFGVLRSILSQQTVPTAQHLFLPFQVNPLSDAKSLADWIAPIHPENYMTILTVLNHPFSRGSVHITSPEIHEKPEWDPRFLSHLTDMEILARHVCVVQKLVETAPLSEILKPGGKRRPALDNHDIDSAKEIIRQHALCVFHPTGSLAMLPRDQGGVVNERLLVHGIKNLRVVDASIFPLQPLGTIQATVYAVAERAANFIQEDRSQRD